MIERARLYLVLDAAAAAVVEPALRGGVDLVQLRDKSAPDAVLIAAAERIGALCRARGVPFVVNDRPDLALRVGADGVHLGQDDGPVEEVRAQVGDALAIGLSTHSPEQIAAAEASSADYYAVGPVWETPTKPGRPAVGLELVRHAAAVASKPWFAIGGIDPSNVGLVAAAGGRRVVVVRAIRDAADPEAAARALLAGLRTEPRPPAPRNRGSRSEAKNAAARARLEPLREGERPLPVTIGALVLAALSLANVVWFASGSELGDSRDPRVLAYSVLTGVIAIGMWRVRYWAVLLMEALLTIAMLLFSFLALTAANVQTGLVCLAIIGGSGTLFWKLVGPMGRMQTPARGTTE